MTQEARRPLHRLTPLRDDPAAVWLTPPQRLRITIAGWMSWSSFTLLWFICFVTIMVVFRMGMMMTSVALLEEKPNPTEDEIRMAISGNLCRCTGYMNIVKSIQYAAQKLRQGA